MDCVTCILVGMCMMCGPGIGARAPGRPMTKAEVDQALSGLISQFRPTTRRPQVTYRRRQSFIPDYRFSDVGIGKRQSDETTLPKPSLLSSLRKDNRPVSNLSDKQAAAGLLFWPELFHQLQSQMDVQDDLSGGRKSDSVPIEENYSERLKSLSLPSSPPVQTVNEMMNKLRLVSLEKQLLKRIAESKRIAQELGKLKPSDGNSFDANETPVVS